jgi:hypothetical protein
VEQSQFSIVLKEAQKLAKRELTSLKGSQVEGGDMVVDVV